MMISEQNHRSILISGNFFSEGGGGEAKIVLLLEFVLIFSSNTNLSVIRLRDINFEQFIIRYPSMEFILPFHDYQTNKSCQNKQRTLSERELGALFASSVEIRWTDQNIHQRNFSVIKKVRETKILGSILAGIRDTCSEDLRSQIETDLKWQQFNNALYLRNTLKRAF